MSYTSLLSLHDHGGKFCQATVYGRRKNMMTNFSFSVFLKPQKLNFREFTYIFYFQRVGIHATKFEKTRIDFNNDVFAAVAIVVAKAP